ncbi:hypothetical protein BBD42_21630 [Paenibacillus sp. BIHB 4019]|uniref:NERD domain-containing protein n=1 Tax=Paenibacillus sp. BIHB 4019 TaxID=1870819 RepID=A0A1B2DM46_9BACL|nr:hypothetical protein [Paenibacillus sp. BIHB 4019]ANY68778.1 hypothetical protein BBD42_21630 [Paenibacillus sp. BIHB 4019]
MKHKADRFREILESLLKNYQPHDYAVFVSNILNDVFNKSEQFGRYPPHFLLHSIQSNCIYHRTNRNQELSKNKLQKILNHYRQYFDPVAMYFLEKDDGVTPFLINMFRQQFFLQWGHGSNSLGRMITLFNLGNYPKSETFFKEKYGMSFDEWLLAGVAVQAYISVHKPQIISPLYYFSLETKIVPDSVIDYFFKINSISPIEVKNYNEQVEKKVGQSNSELYDTYLQGVFVEKPMLQLNDIEYLVIHKELFMRKITEGIFDICKKELPSDFGVEFGESFERYIEKLLLNFIPKSKVFRESQLRQHTSKKVCDFMIVFEDYIYLIESKGVEFSAYISSENAMKQDNSTRKISTGFEQLYSVVEMINNGTFTSLIGESKHKKIIASVITYKQIISANSDWYYENNISPNLKKNNSKDIEFFQYRPQILSIIELELLLKYCKDSNKSYLDVFEERLGNENYVLMGEWYSFLDLENDIIPFLADTHRDYLDRLLPDIRLKN